MTVSSWIDAIYLSKRFPSVPMVIYFGPPVMLVVGEDVVQKNNRCGGILLAAHQGLDSEGGRGQGLNRWGVALPPHWLHERLKPVRR